MISIKKGRKIGFFAALAMLIGTVVGIGIFFKNGSISRATNGEGITWLLAWIVGGIIAGSTAISFSEIGSIKPKSKKVGLPGWTEEIMGKKFGKFIEFNYSFFYLGTLTTVLGVFVSETILQPLIVAGAIKHQIPVFGHILIGLFVVAVLVLINYLSIKTSGIIQKVTTIIKFIPLVFALFIGIILPTTNHIGGYNAFVGSKFSFQALIVALPAVLFAYDAFMIVASLQNKVENGEKKVPLIILVGMLSIVILYTLIAVSSILHNAPIVSVVINNTLPSTATKAINVTIFTFVMISAFGVLNGITAGTVATFEQNVEQNTFAGTEAIKNKIGKTKTSVLLLIINVVFWTMLIGIPAIVLKTDAIYDGASNFPTLFFFAVYGIIIFVYTLKRKKLKTKKINNKIFWIASVLAMLGISIAVGYSLIGRFIIHVIQEPKANASWGVFAAGKQPLTSIDTLIVFSVMLFVFISFPMINSVIMKKCKFKASKTKPITKKS